MTFSINSRAILGALFIVSLFIGVHGHSYVTSPQSRSNQKQTQTGCRGPNCLGPCDVSLSKRSANAAVHTASRGDSITVQWPRNNHAGGFIRFAWAPTTQSDNHTSFDQHVQQISCHETGGCYPDDASNPNGGDSGPGDGSSRACSQSFTVPADLSDGLWTLQWAWFGGAFSLGDYYSCIDYRISGGASGSTPVPKFVGGDYTYPNQQKCKFFNTDKLHVCVNEPCSNPLYAAAQQQSGVPAFIQENFPVITPTVPTTPTVPSTTAAAPVAQPLTTGAAKVTPSTPSTPSTTAAAAVSRPSTTTTGSNAPTPASSTSSSSASCVSGYMKCLPDGSYSTCNHEVWGPSQACGTGTSCSQSGNYIYCLVNPISTPTTPTTPVTPTTPTTPTTPSTSTSSSTPSTPSNPISTGSCTLGYQQCVESNSYQTCGNGRDGPVWAGVQYCQAGLSCHASATANNIYCY